jgi:hypothetical protein
MAIICNIFILLFISNVYLLFLAHEILYGACISRSDTKTTFSNKHLLIEQSIHHKCTHKNPLEQDQ